MQQFMSNNKLPEKPTPSVAKRSQAAAECGGCGGSTGVRESGQEDIAGNQTTTDLTPEEREKSTVVMSGPLGAAVTEALNKSLAKKAAGVNHIANENFHQNLQANGMIYKPAEFLSRMTKAVGLTPLVDEAPTAINTMLDAASKVDQMDFIVVQSIEAPVAQSVMAQKSVLAVPGAGLEGYAVESVQMVVTVRKIK